MVAREELVDLDGVEVVVDGSADSGFAVSALPKFMDCGVIAYIFVAHIFVFNYEPMVQRTNEINSE